MRFALARHVALQAKGLLNALPVALKETIELGTGSDMAVLEASMPFVPALRALPVGAISLWVFKKELQILVQLGLVLLGNQQVVAAQASQERTEEALRMHGISRDNAILHVDRRQPAFDRTDLLLFLPHLMLGQDQPGTRLIQGK